MKPSSPPKPNSSSSVKSVKSVVKKSSAFKRIDCGSGQHYGICTKCKRGHGTVLMERGIFSPALV